MVEGVGGGGRAIRGVMGPRAREGFLGALGGVFAYRVVFLSGAGRGGVLMAWMR